MYVIYFGQLCCSFLFYVTFKTFLVEKGNIASLFDLGGEKIQKVDFQNST